MSVETPGTQPGQETPAAEIETPAQGGTTETVKTFTQAQLDAILTERLQRQERSLTSKYEERLQTSLAEKDTELTTQVEARIESYKREQAITAERTAIATEYGLNETQIAKLTGETPEALRADAEATYGSFKKPIPPALPAGGDGSQAPLDYSKMTPAEIRQHRAAILSATRS